jgi:tetratricopeptide (TPR) repeat protein
MKNSIVLTKLAKRVLEDLNMSRVLARCFCSLALGLLFSFARAQVEVDPDDGFQFEFNALQDVDSESGEDSQDTESLELSPEEIAVQEALILEISRERSARQAGIIAMQSDLGIYDPALQEAYSDFGAFYAEIQDYESAVGLHTDALQVARINTGLYSTEQLPIIDALILNNGKLQDWEEVDDLYVLDYFVAKRVYSAGDSDYIAAIEEYGRWNLRVIRENILSLNSRGLMERATDLSEFYSRELNRIELQTNIEPEKLLGIILAKIQTDLTLARSIARTPFTAFEGTASRYVTESRCRNVTNAQGQVVRQCQNVQVENPRFRQSQRDAKNMQLRRYTRQIETSIERLREIRLTSSSLSEAERQSLDMQIAELETESIQLSRSERSFFRF